MTINQKAQIKKAIREENDTDALADRICDYVDGEFSQALLENSEVGEILKAVGLRIVSE